MEGKFRWKVLRGHDGDRTYREGEERIGTEAELGHLAPRTLEKLGPAVEPKPAAAKSAPAPKNKAKPAAPANKAAAKRKGRGA